MEDLREQIEMNEKQIEENWKTIEKQQEEINKAYKELQETKASVLSGIEARHNMLNDAIASLNKTLEEGKKKERDIEVSINELFRELDAL